MKAYIIFRHTPRKHNGWLGLASLIVRSVTRSYWDHCELMVGNPGHYVCYGATLKGVRGISLEEWRKLYQGISYQVCEAPAIIPDNFLPELQHDTYTITHYDYFSIICQLIYAWVGVWLGLRGKAAKRVQFCAEYVGNKLRLREATKLSPQALYLLTSQRWPINNVPR